MSLFLSLSLSYSLARSNLQFLPFIIHWHKNKNKYISTVVAGVTKITRHFICTAIPLIFLIFFFARAMAVSLARYLEQGNINLYLYTHRESFFLSPSNACTVCKKKATKKIKRIAYHAISMAINFFSERFTIGTRNEMKENNFSIIFLFICCCCNWHGT